jgi:hypothetical protein
MFEHRLRKIVPIHGPPALQAAARPIGGAPMHGFAMKKTTTTTKTTCGGACTVSFG